MTADALDPAPPDLDDLADADTSAQVTLSKITTGVSFVGQKLAITDGDLARQLNRDRWSPSGALSYEGCVARWAIDKLLPRGADPFGVAETGTSGHWVLETLFGLPVRERTLERAISIIDSISPATNPELAQPTDLVSVVRWRSEVLGKIAGLWQIEDPTQAVVIGREMRLDTTAIAGVPFIGIIDRVDLVGQANRAGVVIRDFKTGGVPVDRRRWGDHHGDQLRMYDLAWKDLHGQGAMSAGIYYTAHGETYEADLSAGELDRVKRAFVHSYEQMKKFAGTGEYPLLVSGLCGYCPLVTVCPAGKAAGKTPKTPSGSLGTELGIRVLPGVAAGGVHGPDPDIDVTELDPVVASPDPIWWPSLDDPAPDAVPAENEDGMPTSSVVNDPTEETEMPNYQWTGAESQAWNATNDDGSPNPNSYAAIGAFGFVDLAIEQIEKAGVTLTPKVSLVVAETLLIVVDKAERASTISGTSHLKDGLHTRLRGALRTFIDANPLPFGQDLAAWDLWTQRATNRLIYVSKMAFMCLTEAFDERPYAELAGSELFQPTTAA